MKILNDLTVTNLINNINVSTLNSRVGTLETTITNKANISDLTEGFYNGSGLGVLISINFNQASGITTFVFENSDVYLEAALSL